MSLLMYAVRDLSHNLIRENFTSTSSLNSLYINGNLQLIAVPQVTVAFAFVCALLLYSI